MLRSNPSLGPGVYEEYRYDALGRRVWVRAHRDGGNPPYCGTTTSWGYTECLGFVQRTVWDGDNVLFEIRQHVRSTTSAAALETDRAASYGPDGEHFGIVGYTHGPGIDRPLALRRHLGDYDGGLQHLTLHRELARHGEHEQLGDPALWRGRGPSAGSWATRRRASW